MATNTRRPNPLHTTQRARGHKPAEFAFLEKIVCHISLWYHNDMEMKDIWAQGPPITALPSPLSSPAGCGGLLRCLKYKNSHFGSQNEVAPGQFSAQILSSWVREAKVQRRAASTIRNMFWAWGLQELKIETCGLNYRTQGKESRKRNNFGKLGTVDQAEYCKQPKLCSRFPYQRDPNHLTHDPCSAWGG